MTDKEFKAASDERSWHQFVLNGNIENENRILRLLAEKLGVVAPKKYHGEDCKRVYLALNGHPMKPSEIREICKIEVKPFHNAMKNLVANGRVEKLPGNLYRKAVATLVFMTCLCSFAQRPAALTALPAPRVVTNTAPATVSASMTFIPSPDKRTKGYTISWSTNATLWPGAKSQLLSTNLPVVVTNMPPGKTIYFELIATAPGVDSSPVAKFTWYQQEVVTVWAQVSANGASGTFTDFGGPIAMWTNTPANPQEAFQLRIQKIKR